MTVAPADPLDWLRWLIVALFLIDALVTLVGLLAKLRAAQQGRGPLISFSERMVHVGGAAICFFVGMAMFGYLLDWDSVWRLPMLVAGGLFVLIGRGLELRETERSGR